MADFLLQLEGVKWSVVSGVVNEAVIISVRNLGYSRNAGDFVKTCFADIGNAGGHRAMAKAVVPQAAFRQKFGSMDDEHVSRLLGDLVDQFLMDQQGTGHRRDASPVGRTSPAGPDDAINPATTHHPAPVEVAWASACPASCTAVN